MQTDNDKLEKRISPQTAPKEIAASIASNRVLELYYKVEEVAFLLRFSTKWVRDRINKGEFGTGVLDVRGDLRIPASGINDFLARHRRVYDLNIRLANTGRLRRNLGAKASVASVPDIKA